MLSRMHLTSRFSTVLHNVAVYARLGYEQVWNKMATLGYVCSLGTKFMFPPTLCELKEMSCHLNTLQIPLECSVMQYNVKYMFSAIVLYSRNANTRTIM